MTDNELIQGDIVMWLSNTFSRGGRLGRMNFFLGSLLAMVALGVGFAVVAVLILIMPPVAILTGAVLLGGCLYFSAVLISKRLHDMGMSGWHTAWIMFLSMMPSVFERTGSDAGQGLFALINLGLTLWLLFARGTAGNNEYGLQPA